MRVRAKDETDGREPGAEVPLVRELHVGAVVEARRHVGQKLCKDLPHAVRETPRSRARSPRRSRCSGSSW